MFWPRPSWYSTYHLIILKALPSVLCCPKESDGEVIGSRLVPTFSSTGSKSNVNMQSTANFILSEYFLFADCGDLESKVKSLKCNSQRQSRYDDSQCAPNFCDGS